MRFTGCPTSSHTGRGVRAATAALLAMVKKLRADAERAEPPKASMEDLLFDEHASKGTVVARRPPKASVEGLLFDEHAPKGTVSAKRDTGADSVKHEGHQKKSKRPR